MMMVKWSHKRFLAASASAWLIAVVVASGGPVAAQSTGTNITDAPQPPVADPPVYKWTEVTKGPGFKGAAVSAVAADAIGNIVMVGARYERRQDKGGAYVPTALSWYSTDGLTWTAVEVPDADGAAIQNVIHGADGFMAADFRGLLTSATGEEWTQRPGEDVFGKDGYGVSLARTPTGYIAVGAVTEKTSAGVLSSQTPAAWTSADGLTWQKAVIEDVQGSAQRVVVASDGSMLTAGSVKQDGKSHDALWRSADGGVTWSAVDVPQADGTILLAYGAGKFLLGRVEYAEFVNPHGWWSSVDGTSWEKLQDAYVLQAQNMAGIGATAVAIVGTSVMANGAVLASQDATTWTPGDAASLLGPGQTAAALIGLPDGRLLMPGYDRATKVQGAVVWIGSSDAVVAPGQSPAAGPSGSPDPGSPDPGSSPAASSSPAAQSLEDLAAIYVQARATLTAASAEADKALGKVKTLAAEKKIWAGLAVDERAFIDAISALPWPAEVTDELEPYLARVNDVEEHVQGMADARTAKELDRIYGEYTKLGPRLVTVGHAFRATIGVPD